MFWTKKIRPSSPNFNKKCIQRLYNNVKAKLDRRKSMALKRVAIQRKKDNEGKELIARARA